MKIERIVNNVTKFQQKWIDYVWFAICAVLWNIWAIGPDAMLLTYCLKLAHDYYHILSNNN